MVNPVIEAATAEALLKLRGVMAVRPRWWQKRKWRERERAICDYLITVCRAHSREMLDEPWLPDEEASQKRLAEAIEHAVRAAEDPEVAAVAAALDRALADLWRTDYAAERARRWREWQACPIKPIHTTLEWEAYEAEARAELARREQSQRSETTASEERKSEPMPEEALEEERRGLVEYRARLLGEYKAATGVSEYAIYNARGRDGHTCRKAEFYAWKSGELPASSSMAQSLERFLRAKKPLRKAQKQKE